VTRVVPRDRLDAEVAGLAENLARKLPETIRYTKTQLNFWRELVWGSTIQHARDWLAIHSSADETLEAVAAFHEKRAPRFAELRRLQAGAGRECPECGETGISASAKFCSECGTALPNPWEKVQ
jgi:naphthoate synthase